MNLEAFKSFIPEDKQSEFTELLNQFVAQQKKPLEEKRDELIGKLHKYKESEKSAREAAEAERLNQIKTSTDVESVKKQYQELLEAQSRRTQELEASLIRRELENNLRSAISSHNGIPELLEPHLKGRVKAELVEGQTRLTVLNADGTPKINANGQAASVADLVQEYKSNDIFSAAFRATAQPGTGAKQSEKASSVKNPWAKEAFNLTEQAKLIRGNPAVAKRLAAEVGIDLNV